MSGSCRTPKNEPISQYNKRYYAHEVYDHLHRIRSLTNSEIIGASDNNALDKIRLEAKTAQDIISKNNPMAGKRCWRFWVTPRTNKGLRTATKHATFGSKNFRARHLFGRLWWIISR